MNRFKLFPAYLIFAVGWGARFLFLDYMPFWYDEAFVARVIALPWPQFWAALAADTHPFLYYLLLKCWAAVGGYSEYWLRLPSAIFGLAAVLVAMAIMDRMKTPRVVLVAVTVFMLLSPWQLHYSREARMYAMLQFLVLCAWWALLARRWWLFGLASLAMVYTHNYGLFYLAALWLGGMVIEVTRYPVKSDDPALPPSEWKALTGITGLVLVLWWPWLIVMAGQMSIIKGNHWVRPMTAGAVVDLLLKNIWGSSIPELFGVALAVLAFVTLFIGLARLPRWSDKVLMVNVSIMAFFPLALAVLASVVYQPVLLARGLIGSDLAIYLVAAMPLAWQTRRRVGYVAVLFGLAMIVGLASYTERYKAGGQDMIVWMSQHTAPGDVIYHGNDSTSLVSSWYLPDRVHVNLLPCSQPRGSLSDQSRAALGIPLVDALPPGALVVWSDSPPVKQCNRLEMLALLEDKELMYQSVDVDPMARGGIWR